MQQPLDGRSNNVFLQEFDFHHPMRPQRVITSVRRHSRLLIACLAGAAVAATLPASISWPLRLTTAWNVGVYLFIVQVFALFAGASASDLRKRYEEEDAAAPIILTLVTTAALVSLLAIVQLLATVKHADPSTRDFHLVLAVLTVFGSWIVVPTMFALHYIDMYYSSEPAHAPLGFPEGKTEPVFWDFVYFSFTIAAASQTADVVTRSVSMRRIVVSQSVLAFVFNAAVFGLAVNVSAGLIGS